MDWKAMIQAELDKAKAIQQKADDENRPCTDEEQEQIEAHLAEAEAIKVKALRQQKIDASFAQLDKESNDFAATATRRTHAKPAPHAAVQVEVDDPEIAKDPKKGFADSVDFFQAVMEHGRRGRADRRLELMAAAGSDEHQTQDDSAGGFLVPTAFSPNLLSLDPEMDWTLGQTTNVPMDAPKIEIPARVDENHTSSVAGGIVAYWKSETSEYTTSKMKFRQISLDASKLTVATFSTDELITDSPITVSALFARGMREAMNDKMLDAKINGTGVGQPLGIMNSGATVAVNRSTSGANITGLDCVNMRSRCYNYQNAIWAANIDCYPELAQVHLAGSNSDVFLFNPSTGVDVPNTLLGRPILFSTYTQSIGTKGDLILCNWREYLVGMYQSMRTAESIHVRFLNDETCFKASIRMDGKPWWKNPLTPKRGANTLSPFVVLDVAS